MKVIYTMEQMQELSRALDGLTVTGLRNCKIVALCAQIIDNPVETEEGEKDADNQEHNPQHE